MANGEGGVSETPRELWKVIGTYLEAEHLELDDLEVAGTGNARSIRVVVDAEGGVDVDRLGEVSRGLARVLDARGDRRGTYHLEVSSPGLERHLRRPAHYVKSIGREVKVVTATEIDGATHHRGVIEEADEHGFRLRVDQQQHAIPYDEVVRASTVFEWARGAKPGKKA